MISSIQRLPICMLRLLRTSSRNIQVPRRTPLSVRLFSTPPTGPGGAPNHPPASNGTASGGSPGPNADGGSGKGSAAQKQQMPKWRYFFIIMGLGTLGFLGSLQLVGDKRTKGELSEAEYEALKSKPKQRAFADGEAFVVFVLGGPGSGKGTQCDQIVRDYNFSHLSAGDLLRDEQKRPGSEYGELIQSYIRAGKIVPQEVTIGLLKNAMKADMARGTNHFLIDGFPREMEQALTFEETIVPSKFTLFFECPEQVMLERLLNRGKTSGRIDDNIDTIKKRFTTFIGQSMPVVDYFNTAGKVAKMRCDEPVDQVYQKVQATLKQHGVEPRK